VEEKNIWTVYSELGNINIAITATTQHKGARFIQTFVLRNRRKVHLDST
jgi:hypothetical protein